MTHSTHGRASPAGEVVGAEKGHFLFCISMQIADIICFLIFLLRSTSLMLLLFIGRASRVTQQLRLQPRPTGPWNWF